MTSWAATIEQVDRDVLAKYFTRDAPLGPLNARVVADDRVLELLTEHDLATIRAQSERPSVVVGRRGSGKTSYLRKLGLNTPHALFIEIRTEKTFNLILGAIHNVIRDAISVEAVTLVWEGIVWNCLLWQLHRSGRPRLDRQFVVEHLKRLEITDCKHLDDVMGTLSAMFERVARETGGFALDRIADLLRGGQFERLKALATSDLESTDEVALIVIDSLDDYPVRVEDFKKSLAGLLKCAGEFNAVVRHFEIRMCLPSELYTEFLEKVSTNTTKDFSNQLIVRWQVGELLLAACRRLMVYLMLFHPGAYDVVRGNPLGTRRDANEFIETIFPKQVTNLNGYPEDTILYLLRHTQLLPRQLFILLGEVLKLSRAGQPFVPGTNLLVSQDAIRLGIRDTEGRITDEIFSAFRNRYPEAKEACMSILPSLNKVFEAQKFAIAVKKYCEEFGRQHRPATLRRMLIEIGACGKVTKGSSSYVHGSFEYTMTSQLPVGPDDRLCVHPLFSRIFHCKSRDNDAPVMPTAADL
ncbi:MAG TPA: hypothetical protein VFO28_13755 [Burkholderiaceae bacterium]|nr:hypothetical protein [Burkholderiaceae bacterium]